MRAMPPTERRFDRGTRQAGRAVATLGEEFRQTRLGAGLSQQTVAGRARISRAQYSRIESGKVDGLSIRVAFRIAAVLGLDLSIRAYPGAGPLRDSAHLERLQRLVDHVRAPLRWRTEVPLPSSGERREQRAWDAVIYGLGGRTAVEVELRVRDVQELERRIALKRRDDPTESFLLVLADTRSNRRTLADHPTRFDELDRLRTASVLAELRSGHHPAPGIVLI